MFSAVREQSWLRVARRLALSFHFECALVGLYDQWQVLVPSYAPRGRFGA